MTATQTATQTRSTFNFSAGPAVMPEDVIRRVQQDIWDIDGTGIGIMEHSHRGPVVDGVWQRAEAACRSLAGIPDDYAVLFVQGGASMQFAMSAANYLPGGGTADYINTGSWSKKAIKEATLYGGVHVAGSSEASNFDHIPSQLEHSADPAYVHFTSNNTIFGTEFAGEPTCPDGSFLICDASSDIFSRPIDVRRYGLIYAGAQKNLGPSGVVLLIARRDVAERSVRELPTMLQYKTFLENDSRYNTPPVFGVYVMGLVFEWILEQGGLAAMAERNAAKAKLIYDVLDAGFYKPHAKTDSRSRMNVTFNCPSDELNKTFLSEAGERGFDGLKGHRSVGGIRASIYNAFPHAGCEALAEFMKGFAQRYG
ncbi:MAG: 3-phosphoserine/phosphohydroxythreonine transaminase [Planctomycetota bacterium]